MFALKSHTIDSQTIFPNDSFTFIDKMPDRKIHYTQSQCDCFTATTINNKKKKGKK